LGAVWRSAPHAGPTHASRVPRWRGGPQAPRGHGRRGLCAANWQARRLVARMVGPECRLTARGGTARPRPQRPGPCLDGLVDSRGRVRRATGGILEGRNVAGRPWFRAARHGAASGSPDAAPMLTPYLAARSDGLARRLLDLATPASNARGDLLAVLAGFVSAIGWPRCCSPIRSRVSPTAGRSSTASRASFIRCAPARCRPRYCSSLWITSSG